MFRIRDTVSIEAMNRKMKISCQCTSDNPRTISSLCWLFGDDIKPIYSRRIVCTNSGQPRRRDNIDFDPLLVSSLMIP